MIELGADSAILIIQHPFKIKIEDEESRLIRLQKNSDYKKAKKIEQKEHLQSNIPSLDEIKIKPITEDIKNKILHNLQQKLGAPCLDEGTCIVCDRIVLRSHIITIS